MTTAAKWLLEITDTQPAGLDYRWIRLAAPPEWRSVPGQFVNIRIDADAEHAPARVLDYSDDAPRPRLADADSQGVAPLVRRPVSISYLDRSNPAQPEIVLLVRVVGAGSRRLADRQVGDRLDVVGPLGNGFNLTVPERRAFLVGGGCGLAPLLGVARELTAAGKEVTLFCGANTAANVPLALSRSVVATGDRVESIRDVPGLPGVTLVLSTDDGTAGLKGLVTAAMNAYAPSGDWSGAALYACGPDAMMAAVARLAAERRVSHCQVSLENYMGCAIGVCLSCVVKIRAATESGWTYKRVCVDGPVFEASDVLFENAWEGCKR